MEECDRKKAMKLSNLNWHNLFVSHAEKITFLINDPSKDPEGQKFDIKVSMSKKASLAAAKEVISGIVEIPVD